MKINANGTEIEVIVNDKFNEDYLCLTDLARQKNPYEPKDVVKNWLRLRSTIEFLGLWEQLYNPNFKHLVIKKGIFRAEEKGSLRPMSFHEPLPL